MKMVRKRVHKTERISDLKKMQRKEKKSER